MQYTRRLHACAILRNMYTGSITEGVDRVCDTVYSVIWYTHCMPSSVMKGEGWVTTFTLHNNERVNISADTINMMFLFLYIRLSVTTLEFTGFVFLYRLNTRVTSNHAHFFIPQMYIILMSQLFIITCLHYIRKWHRASRICVQINYR